MKPVLLLILEVPESVNPCFGALNNLGHWHEPATLMDAGLASLFTGASVREHGAFSRWELRPDGQQLRESPRHRLMCHPVWESVAGAVTVGAPWSIGSRPMGKAVSCDFVRCDLLERSIALPDRVWPESLAAELAPLCIDAEELDATTIAELGSPPGDRGVQRELAACLSLHVIATALLEKDCPPLMIVMLGMPQLPSDPLASTRFVEAVVDRYQSIAGQAEIQLLLRRIGPAGARCQALGSEPERQFASSLGMGEALARHFGLSISAQPLAPRHWENLRASYRPPINTLPGTGKSIRSLAERIEQALLSLEGGKSNSDPVAAL